ncbi:MAG: type II toxin-antitoxin system Phd/YefM family antitoxin [Acidimicrobiaceae bacterium]|nr:type II toxin-antitoxin system Phd/YefM family antitoxin [Acidimicrobiaceae bacterium]MYC41688.1 type II toxin-antitoxin system Phd/YefM family antitoxin [Acidimicrobiaceae bacterium]
MAIILEMAPQSNERTSSLPEGRILPAGEFKTNCLRLMDEVNETGTEIIVTKHRRPVVRISAIYAERPELVGSCVDQLQILADIDDEPAIPEQDWDVIERPERVLNPERYQ